MDLNGLTWFRDFACITKPEKERDGEKVLVKYPIKQDGYKLKYYEKNKEEVKRRARIWTVANRLFHREICCPL